jgi:hypothetical protein
MQMAYGLQELGLCATLFKDWTSFVAGDESQFLVPRLVRLDI